MKIKNLLIKYFLKIFDVFVKKNPKPDGDRHSFLIATTTALGDTLWATPALCSLRHHFPNATITVLTSSIGKEVLEHCPYIDEILLFNGNSLLKLFLNLRRKKIDTVLVFHTSQRAVLPLCHLTGASCIIGTKGINKNLDFILTHALEPKPIHEIARRLEIVEKAGGSAISSRLELYVSEEDENLCAQFLANHNISSYVPLIGIHPGAKDKFKQWEPEHFAKMGQHLAEHLGATVLVTGSKAEQEIVEDISAEIPGSIALTTPIPLRVLACLIKKMNLMIVNDTGPMHVAFAMGTPTVAIFGPTDPKLCGPYLASNCVVIKAKPTCTPCIKKSCKEPFCLLQISPTAVYNAAIKLFYNRRESDALL